MSGTASWKNFIAGFDRGDRDTPISEAEAKEPIWEQLDAVYHERVERGDPKWWPAVPLEQLVRERKARA
jgi:hypothetical protein